KRLFSVSYEAIWLQIYMKSFSYAIIFYFLLSKGPHVEQKKPLKARANGGNRLQGESYQGFHKLHQIPIMVIHDAAFLIKVHGVAVFCRVRIPLGQDTSCVRIACLCKIDPCITHHFG